MSRPRSTTTWSNWAQTCSVTPAEIRQVSSTEEVPATIRDARQRGLGVKPVGAGHSFTGIAEAPGVQLRLDGLSGVLDHDRESRELTLAAGTHLHQLPGLLAHTGLAMENLGDIDAQTISGAISTGTHGTGLRFGGIATQVRAMTLVDGLGEVHRVTGDDLAGHVIGLGALGVVTELTLAGVDRFVLDAVEQPLPLAEVLGAWPELVADHDHFEFYWFPHTRTALTKKQRRLPSDAPLRPLKRWQRQVDDELLANGVFELTCRLGSRVPGLIPGINRLCERLTGNRSHTDWSTNVFTTSRRVRFREMEYAVELAALPEVLTEIGALIERRGWKISFPVECRAVGADDLWLSTAHGRDSAYIAVHRYWRESPGAYFREVEPILQAHGGRPHWGKLHTMTAADLAERYPRFSDFLALRDRRDPDRVFANPYLDAVLGR